MNQQITFQFKNDIWLYNTEKGAWHFITLPVSLADEIKELFGDHSKGWGSIPVFVKVGKTRWNTSIFPDKKSGSYVLPLKASVRKAEKIKINDTIQVEITIGM